MSNYQATAGTSGSGPSDIAASYESARGHAGSHHGLAPASPPTPVIAMVIHHRNTDTAWVEDTLRPHGFSVTWVRAFEGAQFPPLEELSGVISLGGPQHVHETDRPAYLDAEISFLAEATHAGRPVLGICLGSQLLAEALGGRATRGTHGPEAGPTWVEINPHATEPMLQGRSGLYFSMHEDSFQLPPGAELLAWSRDYVQAFRVDRAVGVQFHPEISPAGVAETGVHAADVFARAGADPQATTAWARANEHTLHHRTDGIFTSWLQTYVNPALALATAHP